MASSIQSSTNSPSQATAQTQPSSSTTYSPQQSLSQQQSHKKHAQHITSPTTASINQLINNLKQQNISTNSENNNSGSNNVQVKTQENNDNWFVQAQEFIQKNWVALTASVVGFALVGGGIAISRRGENNISEPSSSSNKKLSQQSQESNQSSNSPSNTNQSNNSSSNSNSPSPTTPPRTPTPTTPPRTPTPTTPHRTPTPTTPHRTPTPTTPPRTPTPTTPPRTPTPTTPPRTPTPTTPPRTPTPTTPPRTPTPTTPPRTPTPTTPPRTPTPTTPPRTPTPTTPPRTPTPTTPPRTPTSAPTPLPTSASPLTNTQADSPSSPTKKESPHPSKSGLEIIPTLPQSFLVQPGTQEYKELEDRIQTIYRGKVPVGVTTLEEIAQIARPTSNEFKAFAEKLNQQLIGELPKEMIDSNVTPDQLSQIAKILIAGKEIGESRKIKYTDISKLQEEIKAICNYVEVRNVQQDNGYFKLTINGKDFGFKVYYDNEARSFWNGAIMGAHFLPLQPFQDFYSLHAIGLPINNNTGWVLDEFIEKSSLTKRQGNSWITYMKKVGINPSDHTFHGDRNRIDGVAIDRDDIYFGFASHNQADTGVMSIQEFKDIMNNPDPRVKEQAYNLLIYKISNEDKLEALQICTEYPETMTRLCLAFDDVSHGSDKKLALDILKPILLGMLREGKRFLDNAPNSLDAYQARMAKEKPEDFVNQLLNNSWENPIAEKVANIIQFVLKSQ